MLSVNNYSQKFIDECRSKIVEQVKAYTNLITAVRSHTSSDRSKINTVITNFEYHFFNNLVLALENYFVHRSRSIELKDGKPLNEVMMLCNSLMNNNSIMIADKTIKYDPTKSILKLQIGDEIKLNEKDFNRLSTNFFSEIVRKFCK